jgi:hypothetical protein
MKKDTALSFRVPGALKAQLEKVALDEGRSLSQVCEALLAGGLDVYKQDGRCVRNFFSRQKRERTSS